MARIISRADARTRTMKLVQSTDKPTVTPPSAQRVSRLSARTRRDPVWRTDD